MLPFTEDSPAFLGRVGEVLGRDTLHRRESEESAELVWKLLRCGAGGWYREWGEALIPVGTGAGPIYTVWIHGAGTGAHLLPVEIARN